MIYYWLFKHAPHNRCALWLWRKWAGVITVSKHLRRGNWRQSVIWLRFLVRKV